MEFLAGSITAIVCIYLASVIMRKQEAKLRRIDTRMRQTKKFELLSFAGMITPSSDPARLKTQATDFHDRTSLRIVLDAEKAYWIQNNELLAAELNQNGEMLPETTKAVDTMALDSVELKKISGIVEKLAGKDANNEGGYTGH